MLTRKLENILVAVTASLNAFTPDKDEGKMITKIPVVTTQDFVHRFKKLDDKLVNPP